jgi:hypothetical protein
VCTVWLSIDLGVHCGWLIWADYCCLIESVYLDIVFPAEQRVRACLWVILKG